MSEEGRWLDEAPSRPYFFFSYAHTRCFNQGGTDPDYWVHKLYRDLCQAILQITDLRDQNEAGFINRGMHADDGSADRLSTALARCQVFLPLYSRRYFRSEACGREWGAFASRQVFPLRSDAQHTTCIVPVLWMPTEEADLPEVASNLQFAHEDFGQDDASEGMYALMKLGYLQEAYHRAVLGVARRIVKVGDGTLIRQGAGDLYSFTSAFELRGGEA